MENISVSVRVRPLSKSESQDAWRIDGSTLYQAQDRSDVKYTLDHVFGPSATTLQIYDQTARPLIAKVVNGFNSTIFAYGQTSSGKTFTMRGSSQEAGLIPLAVNDVFRLIEASQDREYLIRVSYTEVGVRHPPIRSARTGTGVSPGDGARDGDERQSMEDPMEEGTDACMPHNALRALQLKDPTKNIEREGYVPYIL